MLHSDRAVAASALYAVGRSGTSSRNLDGRSWAPRWRAQAFRSGRARHTVARFHRFTYQALGPIEAVTKRSTCRQPAGANCRRDSHSIHLVLPLSAQYSLALRGRQRQRGSTCCSAAGAVTAPAHCARPGSAAPAGRPLSFRRPRQSLRLCQYRPQ